VQIEQTNILRHHRSSSLFNQQNVIDELKDVMVYTYVDKDQFWTDKVMTPTARAWSIEAQ
jgi:hypothetical protein